MKEGRGSPNPGHLLYHQPPLNQGPNPSHQQSTATPTMAANVWPQQVGLNYWLPAYYYYYQWQQLLLQSLAGRPLQEVKENGQIRGAGGPNWEQGKGGEEQGKGKQEQGKELLLSLEASYKRVVESPAWLPPGWITEMQTRRSGSSAGTRDKYYKDLMSGRRFRSRNEVIKFLLTGKGRVRCRRKHRVLGITSPPATAQLCGISPLKDRHLLEAPCAGQSYQLAEGSFDYLAVSPVVDATQLFEMESLEEKPNCHASSHVAERPVLGAVQQFKESSFKEKSNSSAASHILTALIEAQIQDKRPTNGVERHVLETHVPAQIHDKRASSGDPETHDKRPSNGVERHGLEMHAPISNDAGIHDKRPSSCVERHVLGMPVSASIEAQIHEKRQNDGAKKHALETYVLPMIEAQINENGSSHGIERHTLETYDAAQLSCEDRKPIHIIETSASGVPDGVSQYDEERTKSCVSKPPSVTQLCRNGWLGETPYNVMERHVDDRLRNSFIRARTNNAHKQPVWEVLDGVYHDEKKITVENTMSVMTRSVPKPSSLLQPCWSSMPSETPSNAMERLAGDKAQLHNKNFLGRMLDNAMGGPVLGAPTGFDVCASSLPGERLNYPIKNPGSEVFARVPPCVKSLFGGKPNSALQMRVSEPFSAVQSCETSLRGEMPYNALERHVLQAHTSGQLCDNSLSGKALNNVISSPVLKIFNEVHLSSFSEKNNGVTESHLSRPFLAVKPRENDSSREKAKQSTKNSVLEAINGGQVPDNDLTLPRLDSGTVVTASMKGPTEIALCVTASCREKHNSAAMERSNLEGLNSPQLCGNSLWPDNAPIEKSIMETSTAAERHKKSLLKVQLRAGKDKHGLGASKGSQICKRPFSRRPVLKAAYTVILACPAPLSTIRELRRSQGHKQASSGLGVSSIAPDKEGQHKQVSSGLGVSSIAPDKEEERKQASSGLAICNIAPDKEEEHKQASSGLGVCNIAPEKEGQHKQASSGVEASNIGGVAVSNIAPHKEGEHTQASSGLGAFSIAPDKEGQQIQAIPGLGVSSMTPDKEEQLHTRPSEVTCQFKGLFGSYKAPVSGQKRPAHSPSKLPVQKKIKFHSPKKGEDKQGSRLWQWLQQSGTVAKKQELVKQEMHTVNSNEPIIAEQRCLVMQPVDKVVSSCSGIPPASGKEREIEAANIDASMCTKMQPDYKFIHSGKEVPPAPVKAREIEAAIVDASRGMKMQPANTTICLAKEVPPALGNAREIQTVKMDAHLGKEIHASPNNIKVGKTVQSDQQLVIRSSMMNVQSSVAQALLVNPWLHSTSCLEIGSQAAESGTVLGSERTNCLPHLAREETQSTQELGRGVVQVSQHQRVHPVEVRSNIGRDSEMQASMLNAQSSASRALQDNARLPSANACFNPSATGLQAAELCSGGGCFLQLAREKTQSAQMHHILGNLYFSRIDNHSGCFFTQLGDTGCMQNPAGRDRGSFAHTQLGKSTCLDLIHTQLGTGNHPGCFSTQCGDAGPMQTPPAGDIGSAAYTQLDKRVGLDQIQTTPLGTDIQVAAQTHSPLVHSSEFVSKTGESSTQLAMREQEKKKKREAERRLEAVLYPKLDLSKLSPGLSSRQKAKVVQKLRAKHGRELLATLGRQLCQRALQQGDSGDCNQ